MAKRKAAGGTRKTKAASGPAAEPGPGARPAGGAGIGAGTAAGIGAGIGMEELRKIPAFSGLGARDAAAFLGHMVLRSFATGEPVFSEGAVGDGLFVVVEGSIRVFKRNPKGGERELAILRKNEVLGEMDLISDRPHTAGARAAESSRLLFLPKREFQKLLLAGNPGATSMLIYFARMLAGRLDESNRTMMRILDEEKKPVHGSEFSEFKRRLLREWTF
ncbi:MAG: cyclic nucleotide-binding domain-containing protein [Planctomycetes bacterium]|nr:cyclic nucleotide-binding domain-containing protein [Planctomycetota bacterium]